MGDFAKYASRAQNNNENVFFDPNLPCDCGLHFFIGPKLFSEKFIFCSKNAFFSCFQGFTKALKKSSPSFILQKWTALTFWWIKNFLDLQKYFRDNPVTLLTSENISGNHNGLRKGLENFLKSNYEDGLNSKKFFLSYEKIFFIEKKGF